MSGWRLFRTPERVAAFLLVLHTGELESLVRLLEYVEGVAPRPEARVLAGLLGPDLTLWARDGRDSNQEHRAAFTYATEQK